VYKGIEANPPAIIQQGVSRGNYAQLHRKAWLEVADTRHRYGKNLRMYYRHWESLGHPTNIFFDWLDSKGGATARQLPEISECPRSVLDSDTVLYITDEQKSRRFALSVERDSRGRGAVLDAKGERVRTGDGWIFVLRDGVLYGTKKITSISGDSKQRFHHSSFFGGKAVSAAGILVTDDGGILTKIFPHSGHYRPGEADMQRLLFFLHERGVDLNTFEVDIQQLVHVSRHDVPRPASSGRGGGLPVSPPPCVAKRKKMDSLYLRSATSVAHYLSHKARFVSIFKQLQTLDACGVREAPKIIN